METTLTVAPSRLVTALAEAAARRPDVADALWRLRQAPTDAISRQLVEAIVRRSSLAVEDLAVLLGPGLRLNAAGREVAYGLRELQISREVARPWDGACLAAFRRREGAVFLDAGCGAGQETARILSMGPGLVVALEKSPHLVELAVSVIGRAATEAGWRGAWTVIRGDVESLPLCDGSVDVVLSRLVLPYVDNRRAFAAMICALRPGGLLAVQVHEPRFYLRELLGALTRGRVRALVHPVHVLLNTLVFELLGVQPAVRTRSGWFREVGQTDRHLRRLAADAGLELVGRFGSPSGRGAPVFLFRRGALA